MQLEDSYDKKGRRGILGFLVFVGDELRVGGWVAGTETTDEGRLYTFEVYARKGEETVATATAGFLVYEL